MNLWVQILIGIFVTDILVGTGHWIEDTWFSYCMKNLLMSEIAKDNEMHHYFPRAVCASSYLENLSVTFVLSIPVVAVIALLLFLCLGRNIDTLKKYAPFLLTVYTLFTLSALIHRFQHDRDCERPWIITYLYKIGLLASNDHHRLHHENPTKKYCVILPWNNYWLDGIGFFRGLEAIVYFALNIRADHKIPYADYAPIKTNIHRVTEGSSCPPRPNKDDVEFLHRRLSTMYSCE
jgi:hypothetical protein